MLRHLAGTFGPDVESCHYLRLPDSKKAEKEAEHAFGNNGQYTRPTDSLIYELSQHRQAICQLQRSSTYHSADITCCQLDDGVWHVLMGRNTSGSFDHLLMRQVFEDENDENSSPCPAHKSSVRMNFTSERRSSHNLLPRRMTPVVSGHQEPFPVQSA